jgi:ankyrin repeat protein
MKMTKGIGLTAFLIFCFLFLDCGNGKSRRKNINNIDDLGRTILHYAVIRGKLDVVLQAIQIGADVNMQDKYGFSPLHYACRRGFLSIVETLIEKNTNLNLKDHYGCTPLHHAAEQGFLEIVISLLNGKADILARDKNSLTPAQLALENKHFLVARPLLPLYLSIQDGDLNQVKFQIDQNPNLINQHDPFERTPLHWAFRFDRNSIIEYLISMGASKEKKDKFGFSPNYYSAQNQSKRTGIRLINQEEVDRFDWLVYNNLKKYLHVNIGLVLNGKVVLTKVYGNGVLSKSYVYGSVSKPVTAMIIHQLLQQGKIVSLDDNIWKYSSRYKNCLPSKYADSSLSIRHLMLHRSGVPHNNQQTWLNGKLNLKFRPGSDDMYSTPGYGILGHLIEDITALPFSQSIKEYIGKPIHAESFGAQKHFRAPGARIYSSIQDMTLFAAGVINHQYVSADFLFNQVLQYQNGTYGLGWPLKNPESNEVTIFHGGSNGRPQAYLVIKPRKKIAVAVLATAKNPRSYELDQLGEALLSALEKMEDIKLK